MEEQHNFWLVALSVGIALIAAYTTVDIALRVRQSSSRTVYNWVIGGSIALGLGMWSMHFIGMLAHSLPVPVGYDLFSTALSIVVAIGAAGLALYIISRRPNSRLILTGGGIAIGIGIGGMHYIGVAAMRMSPPIQYVPSLYILSWAISLGAAFSAIIVGLRLNKNDPFLISKKIGAAAVLGIAVAGVHYVGMAAAHFVPGSVSLAAGHGLDEATLAVAVGLGSFMVLGVALLTGLFDSRLAAEHAAARARLEAQVEARTAALNKAIRARDEFLSIASHELKTPVAALKLQAQLMQRRLANPGRSDNERELVERFAAQVDRGMNNIGLLVARLLDIANIDRGQLVLDRKRMDLAALVKEVVERIQPVLADAGCDLHQEINGPVVGYWDSQRLEQVVTNLLTNVARHARGQPATIKVMAEGARARLIVADQGPGIGAEEQKRIFERFNSARAVSDGTGMGLGLSLARELVKAHGGDIHVESEIGAGTRFTVEIPMHAADEQPRTDSSEHG